MLLPISELPKEMDENVCIQPEVTPKLDLNENIVEKQGDVKSVAEIVKGSLTQEKCILRSVGFWGMAETESTTSTTIIQYFLSPIPRFVPYPIWLHTYTTGETL